MAAMVEQRFDPALDKEPELKRLVTGAGNVLEVVTHETASPALATWALRSEHGEHAIVLHVRDPQLQVETSRTFAPEELQSRTVEMNMLRIWGKLLEHRSAARIERLMQDLRENGDSEL